MNLIDGRKCGVDVICNSICQFYDGLAVGIVVFSNLF